MRMLVIPTSYLIGDSRVFIERVRMANIYLKCRAPGLRQTCLGPQFTNLLTINDILVLIQAQTTREKENNVHQYIYLKKIYFCIWILFPVGMAIQNFLILQNRECWYRRKHCLIAIELFFFNPFLSHDKIRQWRMSNLY